jgi:hypothetical protein
VRRLQLFEILDQPWCPQAVRDGATDFLEFITNITDLYSPARPLLLASIRQSGSRNVVDLCSGGGGPWLSRAWRAARSNREWPLTVFLTDKFPSAVLRSRLDKSDDSLRMVNEPVDATQVPSELSGFRTIFASFHHFSEEAALRLLEDAVSSGEGIATAEVTSRTFKALAVILLMPWACLLMTPFMRPFRVSRLLLTYLVPLIPFTVLWDGLVSCARTRTPQELKQLAKGLDQFNWTSGYLSGSLLPLQVVYLVGVPVTKSQAQFGEFNGTKQEALPHVIAHH